MPYSRWLQQVLNKRRFLPLFLIAVFAGLFTVMATRANLDLIDGRHALFMDERIVFDGVSNIFHAANWYSMLWHIYDGGDHRYGRLLYNGSAVLSFVPEMVWGASGQIVAGRTFQLLCMLVAIFVLVFSLVENWWIRAVAVACLTFLPFVDYYATMPKPEPVQLLSLALFFAFAVRSGFSFGWHWVFMGVVFGAKISGILFVAPFGLVALSVSLQRHGLRATLLNLGMSVAVFLLGWGLTIPMLLPMAFLAAVSLVAVSGIAHHSLVKGALAFLVSTALIIGLYFWKPSPIQHWLRDTFLNMGHGSDQSTIGPMQWARFFVNDWLISPAPLSIALLFLIALFVVSCLSLRLMSGRRHIDRDDGGFVLVTAGLIFNLSIMLTVQRLWGIYLVPGTLVILTGVFCLIDLNWRRSLRIASPRAEKTMRLFSHGLLFLFVAHTVFYWVPNSFANLNKLAHRTKEPHFILEQKTFIDTMAFLAAHSRKTNRKLVVAYDPNFFVPASTGQFQIEEYWGRFVQWQKKPDIITLGYNHLPGGPSVLETSPQYSFYISEQTQYKKFVIGPDESCHQAFCYRRMMTLPNRGELLVLVEE